VDLAEMGVFPAGFPGIPETFFWTG